MKCFKLVVLYVILIQSFWGPSSCFISTRWSIVKSSQFVTGTSHLTTLFAVTGESSDGKDIERWTNPAYEDSEINEWWKKRDPLLTIGSGGVNPSHINSLEQLVDQHNYVRVKLATDKINPHDIARKFVESEKLNGKIELLEVRKKGFMVGKKQ